MPNPIAQRDPFGCAVACVAHVLDIPYAQALRLFKNGERHAKSRGFYCKEIVAALQEAGVHYEYKYVNAKIRKKICRQNTIVFIRRSNRYPAGHYLARHKKKWMDPWINFSKNPDITRAKAGFRKRLPGKPIYAILKEKRLIEALH